MLCENQLQRFEILYLKRAQLDHFDSNSTTMVSLWLLLMMIRPLLKASLIFVERNPCFQGYSEKRVLGKESLLEILADQKLPKFHHWTIWELLKNCRQNYSNLGGKSIWGHKLEPNFATAQYLPLSSKVDQLTLDWSKSPQRLISGEFGQFWTQIGS